MALLSLLFCPSLLLTYCKGLLCVTGLLLWLAPVWCVQLGTVGGPSAGAGFSSLKYLSLNESVAAVDPETGLVTAVAEGVAVSRPHTVQQGTALQLRKTHTLGSSHVVMQRKEGSLATSIGCVEKPCGVHLCNTPYCIALLHCVYKFECTTVCCVLAGGEGCGGDPGVLGQAVKRSRGPGDSAHPGGSGSARAVT